MDRPTDEVWRKSTRSGGQNGNCVELSNHGAVRDSKNPAVRMQVGRAALTALVASVRRGAGR